MNDDDRPLTTDAPRTDDLNPTVVAHWDATVHDDLGDTVPMQIVD